jgi:hypothetical protein
MTGVSEGVKRLARESVSDHGYLTTHPVDQAGAVSPPDVQPTLSVEPSADNPGGHLALVPLGVDHEDAGRRDCNVVDIRPRAGNASVVQDCYSGLGERIERLP